MNEKELSEFSLEDIINEFRDDPTPDESVEEPELSSLEEMPEEISLDIPEEVAPETVSEPDLTADTIRMEPIGELPKGQVSCADPVEDMEATKPLPTLPKENWEPEYEPPVAPSAPPKQILIHPQAKIQELKGKLIAGPEKRYYELTEKGMARLQILIFLSFLVVLISAGATVLYTLNMVQEDRLRLMIFGQLLGMFLSALIGCNQLITGVGDLVRGRFSLNTLLIFTFVLCCVDGVLCLQQLRVPCCAAFSLEVSFALCSTLHRRRTEINQMDTLRKANSLTAIRVGDTGADGTKLLLRGEGQVEDFMDHYGRTSKPGLLLGWYGLCALVCALALGIVSFFLYDLTVAVQVAAVTLLASVPASGFICLSRPAAILEKRLHALGTVLCGWRGVAASGGKVMVPIHHEDLFPNGSAKMNGVKFFGNRNTDEVLAYASALITASGNGLAPLFHQALESRNIRHLAVVALRDYDGGIGGEVMDEPVLIGSLSFLRTMGVEIPEGLRVTQAVCVAIDGELCGLFAITYEKTRSATSGLTTLCAYQGLNPILTAGDDLLTPGFLQAKFGVNPKRIIFPDNATRKQLVDVQVDPDSPAIALTTREGLAPLAYGITGARALNTAAKLGVTLHMAGGIIGILIMLILVLLNAVHLLTPANVFLYQLVWVLPSLLITEWTRLI